MTRTPKTTWAAGLLVCVLGAGAPATPTAAAQGPDVACTVPVGAAAPELDDDATDRRTRTHRIATGAGVKVAVIDTGVADHEQLRPVHHGGDFVAPDAPDAVFDCDGHGTAVAGLIASHHLGVAPDAEIISVRQTSAHYRTEDDGAGTLASLAEAIHAAVHHGADVINVSVVACVPAHLTEHLDTSGLDDALARAEDEGAVIVAAAGNASESCLPGDAVYPAHAPTVLAVGARADAHRMADYSVPAPPGVVELSAPGTAPVSLAAAGSGWATGTRPAGADPVRGSVTAFEGSSFAAPVVSGTVALLAQRYPEDSAAVLRDRVIQAARPAGGLVLPYETLTHVSAQYERGPRELHISAPHQEHDEAPARTGWALMALAAVAVAAVFWVGLRRG